MKQTVLNTIKKLLFDVLPNMYIKVLDKSLLLVELKLCVVVQRNNSGFTKKRK